MNEWEREGEREEKEKEKEKENEKDEDKDDEENNNNDEAYDDKFSPVKEQVRILYKNGFWFNDRVLRQKHPLWLLICPQPFRIVPDPITLWSDLT